MVTDKEPQFVDVWVSHLVDTDQQNAYAWSKAESLDNFLENSHEQNPS